MKAYKVDVKEQRVYEVDIPDTLEGYYAALECDIVESVHLMDVQDCLLVDEEYWLRNHTEMKRGFIYLSEDGLSPMGGHGLVLGYDTHGAFTAPNLPLEHYADSVRFVEFAKN